MGFEANTPRLLIISDSRKPASAGASTPPRATYSFPICQHLAVICFAANEFSLYGFVRVSRDEGAKALFLQLQTWSMMKKPFYWPFKPSDKVAVACKSSLVESRCVR